VALERRERRLRAVAPELRADAVGAPLVAEQLGAHRDDAVAALRRRPARAGPEHVCGSQARRQRDAVAAAPATRERGGVEGVEEGYVGMREGVWRGVLRWGLQDARERGLGGH
jgi:hypothetical protein